MPTAIVNLLDYNTTPSRFLFHANIEVPVLFQGGSGRFAYYNLFKQVYRQRWGEGVNPSHRISNLKALELYAELGPWLSNAPGSNSMVAVAPKKGLPAIRVHQIHTDGTEDVYIDPRAYAAYKTTQLGAQYPGLLQERTLKTNLAFPWEEAYHKRKLVLCTRDLCPNRLL